MSEATNTNDLTEAQKARIERNRLKAKSLQQAKLQAFHPYAANGKNEINSETSIIKVQGTKFIDSGGGFLIEQPAACSDVSKLTLSQEAIKNSLDSETLDLPVSTEECLECGDAFVDSYLFSNFSYKVCDKCRDPDDAHSLITRTEAKAEYLLKDCDFDKREPALRFISRKNPHNVRWGEMKLYLRLQIEKRALEVWGSEEELMKQHEGRDEKREVGKIKRYNKQMTQLRKEMRSSLFKKKTVTTHTHEFGPDTYNEEDDTYTHSCPCGYIETYEKM